MPDIALWSLAYAFTVDQAASLWVGAEPTGNKYTRPPAQSDRVAAIHQMLTSAIVNGDLDADSLTNYRAKFGNYSESLVKREDLQEFAKKKGQFPAFLFDTLLPGSDAADDEIHDPPKQSRAHGGRPPEYDWDAFTIEIIRIADLDGLPDRQSELIDTMLQWCENTWGKQPAESSVKARISQIFNGLGRGRKPRLMGSP